MTGGQRAVIRGNCAPMDDCQFTRVKETGKLVAKEVIDPFARAVSHEVDIYRQRLIELSGAHVANADGGRDPPHGAQRARETLINRS